METNEIREPLFDVRRCRLCGCTDERACPGGCWWLEQDLCSSCAQPSAKSFADGLRAVVILASAELRHAGVMAGYWLRPYDQAIDRRRWRWQRGGCWRGDPAQAEQVQQLAARLEGHPEAVWQRPPVDPPTLTGSGWRWLYELCRTLLGGQPR